MIDTDERRAVVRRLTDAIYDFLTLDVEEYERATKAGVIYSPPKRPDFAEQLAQAVEQRDQLQEHIVEMRRKLEDVPDVMRTGIEMAMIDPIVQRLQDAERWIFEIQKQIEAGTPQT